MPVCPGFLEDTGPGCDLAPNHGGPHFTGGLWWERRDDPPNWKPPRFTVICQAANADRQLQFQVVVDPDATTELDLLHNFGLRLTFSTIRIP